ncbi:MAG: HAMP domain-containing histidine kinase, partial [Clostridiales bacterium]|nr:HAMP domain-containing histidine kinase [Clostridiales bacterium]
MIRKLRIKLVMAAMFSLFIVLSILIALISILNYRSIVSNADIMLSVLASNNGDFPDSSDDWANNDFLKSPELPYESRYFYVSLDSTGNVLDTDIDQIAAVDDSTASVYAQKVWDKGDSQGFVDDYRYIVYKKSSHEIVVIFLDCGRNLDNLKTFVNTSIVVAVAGLVAVLLLLFMISGRIVRPFSENYEKQIRFITDAGHELKTPLACINADAEVLEMDFGENEWLADIQKQTRQMADLTADLITLTRASEGSPKEKMLTVSLSDIAQKAADPFQSLAKAQKKTILCNIQPNLMMRCDEKAMHRLIVILLDNAVKYSAEEGKISLTLTKKRNLIQLVVYNTTPFI